MANAPEISVIIPMYNAEKYITECLDSVLAQTFQDYEVILVNDASTDNGRKIVENYEKKFDGRLSIYDNEKNIGPGGTRNNGLLHANGEYVFFMDADDLIMSYALEKTRDLAKRFKVDILNSTSCYTMNNDGSEMTRSVPRKLAVDKHVLDTNMKWRIKHLMENNFRWAPWRKLVRREFLIENELFFPVEIRRAEDVLWTHALWFFARRIIHVPLAFYTHRHDIPAASGTKPELLERINFRAATIVRAMDWIVNVMDRAPFFKKNPKYRYPMLKHIVERFFMIIFQISPRVSSVDMYESLKEECEKNLANCNFATTIPVLFTLINEYHKILAKNLADNDRRKLEKYLISAKA